MNIITTTLAIVAAAIALGGYVPYARDILKGRVLPSRATRIMFALLFTLVLLQQRSLGSGLTLAVTVGEGLGSFAILLLAIKHGTGGWHRHELICYGLLVVDVMVWWGTRNALLGLTLSIMADCISFAPALIKAWRRPETETPLFYWSGVVAPLMSIFAGADYRWAIMLYPLSLMVENGTMVGILYLQRAADKA